jgi:hypothetical protein
MNVTPQSSARAAVSRAAIVFAVPLVVVADVAVLLNAAEAVVAVIFDTPTVEPMMVDVVVVFVNATEVSDVVVSLCTMPANNATTSARMIGRDGASAVAIGTITAVIDVGFDASLEEAAIVVTGVAIVGFDASLEEATIVVTGVAIVGFDASLEEAIGVGGT